MTQPEPNHVPKAQPRIVPDLIDADLHQDPPRTAAAPIVTDLTPFTTALARSPVPRLAIDNDSIMAAVVSGEDTAGSVELFHADLFDAEASNAVTLLGGLRGTAERLRTSIAAHIDALVELAERTDVFIATPGTGVPWTSFALAKAYLFAIVCVVLLGVGVISIAQILMAAGIFEAEWRCYAFSLVPVGAACAAKALGAHLQPDRNQRRFTTFLLTAGIFLSTIWAWLFVTAFPQLMETAETTLARVGSDGIGAADPGSRSSGIGLLFVGLLSEIALAGGLSLSIENIVAQHRPPGRAENPRRVVVETRLSAWQARLNAISAVTHDLHGRLVAFTKARDSFIAKARVCFTLRRSAIELHRSTRLGASDDQPDRSNPDSTGDNQ